MRAEAASSGTASPPTPTTWDDDAYDGSSASGAVGVSPGPPGLDGQQHGLQNWSSQPRIHPISSEGLGWGSRGSSGWMGRTGSTWASPGDLSTMQCALPAYRQSAPGANYQSPNANLTPICRSKLTSFRTQPDWPNLPRQGSGRATPCATWVSSATSGRTWG